MIGLLFNKVIVWKDVNGHDECLQLVPRKSVAYGSTLAQGLHEGAKMIEKNDAQLCYSRRF